MSLSNDVRSIPALFGDAIEQLGKLVSNEVQLARAEISEKVAQAGMGVAYVAAAGVLMIPVLVVLLITLALWLNQMGMSPVVSHLIAAAVGAAVSLILGLVGLNHLKPEKLTPTVTIQQVERDVAAAKELAK
jgi:Putative Actinobacterial Holin-X, holin superfamily III